MITAEELTENVVDSTDSYEGFKSLVPNILKDMFAGPKSLTKTFINVINTIVQSDEEGPANKFYALYLLLKASESAPNLDFATELSSREDLLSYISQVAQYDLDKKIPLHIKGKTFFSNAPNATAVDVNTGINYIRLAMELYIFWGTYFGKSDMTDSLYNFWFKKESLAKKTTLPTTYRFLERDYLGNEEIATWDFNSRELPAAPTQAKIKLQGSKQPSKQNLSNVDESLDLHFDRSRSQKEVMMKEANNYSGAAKQASQKDYSYQKEPSLHDSNHDKNAYLNTQNDYLKSIYPLEKTPSNPKPVSTGAGMHTSAYGKIEQPGASRSRTDLIDKLEQSTGQVGGLNESKRNTSFNEAKKTTLGMKMAEKGIFTDDRDRSRSRSRSRSPTPTAAGNTLRYAKDDVAPRSPTNRNAATSGAVNTIRHGKDDSISGRKTPTSTAQDIRNFFTEKEKSQMTKPVSAVSWQTKETSNLEQPQKNYGELSNFSQYQAQYQAGDYRQGFESQYRAPPAQNERVLSSSAWNVGGQGSTPKNVGHGQVDDFGRTTKSRQDSFQTTPQRFDMGNGRDGFAPAEIDNLRKENALLRSDVERYQRELQQRKVGEENLMMENSSLKAELERCMIELQKRNDRNETLLKENGLLKSKFSDFQQQFEDMTHSINQLTAQNRQLNEIIAEKDRQLEGYQEGEVRHIVVPNMNKSYGNQDYQHYQDFRPTGGNNILPMGGGGFDSRDNSNMGSILSYLDEDKKRTQNDIYFPDSYNNQSGSKKKIFERVAYDKPKMVLTPKDYSGYQ